MGSRKSSMRSSRSRSDLDLSKEPTDATDQVTLSSLIG